MPNLDFTLCSDRICKSNNFILANEVRSVLIPKSRVLCVYERSSNEVKLIFKEDWTKREWIKHEIYTEPLRFKLCNIRAFINIAT